MQAHQDNISAKVSGVLTPILGVQVTVIDTSTGKLAALYSDNGVTKIDQPLTTDETGYFGFYAANGHYSLAFFSPQIKLGPRVVQLYDPADDLPLTQAQAAASSGASKIGIGAETVENALNALQLADYAALRAYTGPRKSVYVVASGLAGMFVRDDSDTTTADSGGTVIVATNGKRWKRSVAGALNAKWFGAVGNGNADDTAAIQAAIDAAYAKNGGSVLLDGNFKTTQTINLKPYVILSGPTWSAASIQYYGTNGTTVIATVKPAGYAPPLVLGAGIERLTINGRNQSYGYIGIDASNIRNCLFDNLEIANMVNGLYFNKSAGASGQAFWNKVSQCSFASCYTAVAFGGAANRNTFDTNTYNTCNVCFDFSVTGTVAETNVFINENVEGCNSWAEWGATIYGQTWIGLTVENPASNNFRCTVKDPGRQLFINLGMIPANTPAALDFYKINSTASTLVGSVNSSAAFSYGHRICEEFQPFAGIRLKAFYGTANLSATIAAGAKTFVDIPVTGAEIGDIVTANCYDDLQGCILTPWVRVNGSVRVYVINPTAASITTGSTKVVVATQKYG